MGAWHLAEQAAEDPASAGVYAPADVPATLADAGWDASKGPATWTATTKALAPAGAPSGEMPGRDALKGVSWFVDAQDCLHVYPTNEIYGEFDLEGSTWPDKGWAKEDPASGAVAAGVAVADGGSAERMFQGNAELASLDVSKLETSGARDMSKMFSGCSGLTKLDLSKLNTSNVTSMSSMFAGCSKLGSLTGLDAEGFDVSKVESMSSMFEGCLLLGSAPLSPSPAATDVSRMYADCPKVGSLPASFALGAQGAKAGGCFRVDAALLPEGAKALDLRYEGDDPRMFEHDWAGSNRRLVAGDMEGAASIEGSPQVGTALQAKVEDAPEKATLSFQWTRSKGGGDPAAIPGATGASYEPVEDDYGCDLAVEVRGSRGTAVYDGSISSDASGPVGAPQVTVAVPLEARLSMDAAGEVSAPAMKLSNEGAYRVRLAGLAPVLADRSYPAGSWSVAAGAGAAAAASGALLTKAPFLAPGAEPYDLPTGPVLAPGAELRLFWTAAFGPADADRLASLAAAAGGTLSYGTFAPVVAYEPPEGA